MKKRVSLVAVVVMVLLLVGCGKTYQKEYDLGVRYLSEGNYEEAVIAFTAAIEIEPNHAEAYVGLADTYIGMSDLAQARDVLAGGLGVVDDDTMLHGKLSDVEYDMGQEELEKGNYDEAVEHFQGALEHDPDREDAYLGLADAYLGQGDKEKAVEALKDGVEHSAESDDLKGKLSDVEFDLGKEKLEAGEYEEAIELLQDSLANNPEREGVHGAISEAYVGLADAYMEDGDIEKALEALDQALVEDEDSVTAKNKQEELRTLKEALDSITGLMVGGDIDVTNVHYDEQIAVFELLAKYNGYCYNGEKLIKNYTGVGMKVIGVSQVYYGDLANGQPEGNGIAVYNGDDYCEYFSGPWSGGKPNGNGYMVATFGNYDFTYNGTLMGTATGTWTYEGEFVNGIGEGAFTLTLNLLSGYLSGATAVYYPTVSAGEAWNLSPSSKSGFDFWPMNFDHFSDIVVTGY